MPTIEAMETLHAGPQPTASGLDIVVSSVLSDAHTWNLAFLQLVLEESGHRVTNLGPCVPEGLLVDECVCRRPDLVVISTVNGHGFRDGLRVIQALRNRAGTAHLPVVIGGKLGITGGSGGAGHGTALLAAGYDAVFDDDEVHITGLGVFPPDDDSLRLFRSFVGSLPATVPC